MSQIVADHNDDEGDLVDARCVGPANLRTIVATRLTEKMSIPDICKAVEEAGAIHVAYRFDESVRVEFFNMDSATAAMQLPNPVILDSTIELHLLSDEIVNNVAELNIEG
jgi:hypothetical protein